MKTTRTKEQRKADARRPGRPPLPAEVRRSVRTSVAMTRAEARALQAAARERGLSVGELLMLPFRRGGE